MNALWVDLLDELVEAFEREVAAGTPAVVLTGAGACFSAGIDTKAAAGADGGEQVAGVKAINRTVSTSSGCRCRSWPLSTDMRWAAVS